MPAPWRNLRDFDDFVLPDRQGKGNRESGSKISDNPRGQQKHDTAIERCR
jgi:hypothetical protein